MSTDLDLTEAIAALSVCTCPEGRNQHGYWRHVQPTCPRCGDAEAKVRAVAPLIERLIRESIAADLDAVTVRYTDVEDSDYKHGLRYAARIARQGAV